MSYRLKLSGLLTGLLFCVLTLSFSPSFAQSMRQRAVVHKINGTIGGFYEALPPDYEANPNKKYPLLIFIHGIGELGSGSEASLKSVLRNGPPKLIANGKFPSSFNVNGQNFSFIVISPQFKTQDRTGKPLELLIDYLQQNYRIDASRIYLTGLSMGGGISWIFAGTKGYTQKLAALAPVCGNAKPYDAFINNIVEESLPVWAFHNEKDYTVPSLWTKEWFQMLTAKRLNPAPKETIFNAGGHDAWSRAYDPNYRENGQNIYEWMLSHSKNGSTPPPPPPPPANRPPSVNAGPDQTITLPVSSLRITATGTDPDGSVTSYEWEKVSGPSSITFKDKKSGVLDISNLVAGTYVLRVKATDNKGATATDDVTVLVNAANRPPVVNAGNDKVVTLPLALLSVTATGSDPDGSIRSYAWTKLSGPAITLANLNTATVALTALAPGTITLQVKVTDDKGATATDEIKITVNAAIPIPLPDPGPKTVKVNIYGGSNAYIAADWNNWNVGTKGGRNITSSVLKYEDGKSSGIKAILSQSTGIGDNTGTYVSGMAPSQVLRFASYSTVGRSLSFTGLKAGKSYSVEVFASRIDHPGNSTTFISGNKSITVATYKNATKKAVFTIVADAKGKAEIKIRRTNTYSYINGFTVREVTTATATAARLAEVETIATPEVIETPVTTPDTDVEEAGTETITQAAAADRTLPAATGKADMLVYPNPATDRVTLAINNELTGPVKVQLYDLSGRLYKEFNLNKPTKGAIQLPLTLGGTVNKGNYVLLVRMGDWKISKQLSKQ